MNLSTLLSNKAMRFVLISLLALLTIVGVTAKVVGSKPSPIKPLAKATPYPNSKNAVVVVRENSRNAIYAKGNNVVIEDAGNGQTRIWIDENNNGTRETSELAVSNYSNYYIYGGALDQAVMKDFSITMTGGTIGGIFGGGYACNAAAEVTGNITITVTGGSIGYVDGGGEAYDNTYSCKVTGNVDITLSNCEYRGSKYINDNKTTGINGKVYVRDFSNHTYGASTQWGKTNSFTASMIQTAANKLYIDWKNEGYGYIPEDVDMTLDALTVTALSVVSNNGKIAMTECRSSFSNLGIWYNHSVELPHKLSTEVRGKDADRHALVCSDCGSAVRVEHSFTLMPSTSQNADGATHTWICTVCQQEKAEDCTPAWGYNNDSTHVQKCTKCNHIFATVKHSGTGTPTELSADYHIRKCDVCGVDYKEEHTFSGRNNCACGAAPDLSNDPCTNGDHQSSLEWIKKTVTRTYNAPDSVISYNITREEPYCKNCEIDIACSITDAQGSRYFATLDEAFQYAVAQQKNNATIKLLRDNNISEVVNAALNGYSMTLDMNNCDIKFMTNGASSAQLVVKNGTLNVVNTNNIVTAEDGTQTKQYANIYNANSTNSIVAQDGGIVRLDGVHVSNLTIGAQKFTFADVEVERLTINADTYPLNIEENGQVTIFQYLNTQERTIKSILPTGIIISQYQKGGAWDRRYDHTTTVKSIVGPRYNSNLLRIESCDDHYVLIGISHTETGHSGTCTYCGKSVTNVAHRMTQSGAKIDDQYHYKRCKNCGYEAGRENHTFDEKTGYCTDNLCKAPAVAELHEQGGEKPIYFASFEAAWDACNLGRADTIVLLKNYTVTRPLTVRYGLYDEEKDIYSIAYPLVVSDGYTLSYSGSGDPLVTQQSGFETEFVMRLNPGLKCTNNWSEGPIKATPTVGAVFNEDKTEVLVCPAHECTYKQMVDDNNHVLTFHEATCTKCRLIFDENHTYDQGTKCIHCKADRAIVANGTIEGKTDTIAQYGSLNEAIAHAASYSAENGKPVTIHVLTDLNVDNHALWNSSASAITLNTPGADVIIDATDPKDPTHEFKIKCYRNAMITVVEGRLTILSGKYQSATNAIVLAYNAKGKVQIKGGTFLKGSLNDAYDNNYDAIVTTYSYSKTDEVAEGAGVRTMIAPGYIMKISETGHEDNKPTINTGDSVSFKSPATVISANGTVYQCTHTSLGAVKPAQELTCTQNGIPSYQLCNLCGAAIQKDGEGKIISANSIEEITTAALGHQYVKVGEGDTAKYICKRELTLLYGGMNQSRKMGLTRKESPANISEGQGTTYICNDQAKDVTVSCVVIDRVSGDTISSKLACNEVGFESFFSAWNTRGSFVTYANYFSKQDPYDQNIKIITTYTLHTDIDLSGIEGQHLIDMCIFHDYVIDLNGHDLNLGDYCIRSNNWSYYPGQDALTIRDSKKEGKTFTGNLNLNGTYPYEPYKPKYSGEKDLILEDVTVKTNTLLYNVQNTYLYGQAGIVLAENDSVCFGYINMEPGCFLEGHGTNEVYFYYRSAQSLDVAKAMHNVRYYDTDSDGRMTEIQGQGTSTLDGSTLHVYMPDGKTIGHNNVWRATVPSGAVTHSMEGDATDHGSYHEGLCSICGYNGQNAHTFVNHVCMNCLHIAEAYSNTDGVYADYNSLVSAIDSVKGKKATVVMKQDARTNFIIADNTDLTLNLNDHRLTSDASYAIFLEDGKLTISDGAKGQGAIINTQESGSAIVMSSNTGNALTIKGGDYQANDGALTLKATKVNAEECPSVTIYDGTFSSIRTGSTRSDVIGLLGKDSYFRSNEDDKLIETAPTFQYANSTRGYSYLEDVYACSKDLQLTGNEAIDIDNVAEAAANQYQDLVAEAISNLGVNSFGRTDIEDVADLHDIRIMNDLQQATTAAGITRLLTQDEDVKAYLEAQLVAATVESAQVVGSGDNENVYALTRMTFDLQPYAYVMIDGKIVSTPIDKEKVQGTVAFRLPVDKRFAASVLEVTRTEEDGSLTQMGQYPVQNLIDKDGVEYKYIELESDKLTTFSYKVSGVFTLADAEVYEGQYTQKLESVSYVRNFANSGSWEALYIPMSIQPTTDCDIAEIYTFGNMIDTNENGKVDEEDELVLIVDKLTTADVTEANTPYVIRSSSTGEKTFSSSDNVLYKIENYIGACTTTRTRYTFNGTYTGKLFNSSDAGYTLQDGKVKLEAGTLEPQRWYIEITSKVAGTNPEVEQAQASAIRIFTIGEDMDRETALRLLQGETVDVWQNGKRYTLDGRRAVGSTQGIQIINNKKVIKK